MKKTQSEYKISPQKKQDNILQQIPKFINQTPTNATTHHPLKKKKSPSQSMSTNINLTNNNMQKIQQEFMNHIKKIHNTNQKRGKSDDKRCTSSSSTILPQPKKKKSSYHQQNLQNKTLNNSKIQDQNPQNNQNINISKTLLDKKKINFISYNSSPQNQQNSQKKIQKQASIHSKQSENLQNQQPQQSQQQQQQLQQQQQQQSQMTQKNCQSSQNITSVCPQFYSLHVSKVHSRKPSQETSKKQQQQINQQNQKYYNINNNNLFVKPGLKIGQNNDMYKTQNSINKHRKIASMALSPQQSVSNMSNSIQNTKNQEFHSSNSQTYLNNQELKQFLKNKVKEQQKQSSSTQQQNNNNNNHNNNKNMSFNSSYHTFSSKNNQSGDRYTKPNNIQIQLQQQITQNLYNSPQKSIDDKILRELEGNQQPTDTLLKFLSQSSENNEILQKIHKQLKYNYLSDQQKQQALQGKILELSQENQQKIETYHQENKQLKINIQQLIAKNQQQQEIIQKYKQNNINLSSNSTTNNSKKPVKQQNDQNQNAGDTVQENQILREFIAEQEKRVQQFKEKESKMIKLLMAIKKRGIDIDKIYNIDVINDENEQENEEEMQEQQQETNKLLFQKQNFKHIRLESQRDGFADCSVVNESDEGSFRLMGQESVDESIIHAEYIKNFNKTITKSCNQVRNPDIKKKLLLDLSDLKNRKVTTTSSDEDPEQQNQQALQQQQQEQEQQQQSLDNIHQVNINLYQQQQQQQILQQQQQSQPQGSQSPSQQLSQLILFENQSDSMQQEQQLNNIAVNLNPHHLNHNNNNVVVNNSNSDYIQDFSWNSQ